MSNPRSGALGPAQLLGHRFGGYRVEASVGSGGMASVYRAVRESDGVVVALKVLHPSSVAPEDRKRFTREFQILSQMDHPNVVRVYETGVEGHYPWIAMEFVDGENLGDVIERWQHAAPSDRWVLVERILRGLCAGLAYVHERGLVHRDLKPTNVLVNRDGEAKLTDFGVVKDPNATGTQLTVAGRLVGTVAFMAPEQIAGDTLDARADLYALGAVLYMMLTYRRPIEAQSVAGYLARHLTETPTAPGQLDSTVPPRLERICQRLLLKDPAQRHPSAAAVLAAIDRADDGDRPPLRGRDPLLQRWSARVAELAQGGGGVVAVTGPRGSGRSLVLSAMVDTAEAAKIHVLRRPREVERPSLLVVDDLDRDPDAIDALARAVREGVGMRGQPLLVLFSATDAEGAAHGLLSGAATGVPCERYELSPLDRASVTAMLRDRALVGAAAPTLGRRLHEDHGGMPGPIVEQLEALERAGWLERTGEALRPTRPIEELRVGPLPVPPGVRAAIVARLGGVSDAERTLLEVLALVERPANAALVERCVEAADAAQRVDGLVRAGLLARSDDGAQELVTFAHPSTVILVEEALPAERRRAHHATIARALLARRRRDAAGDVAHHLLEAGDLDAAYPMFVASARRSARSGRPGDVLAATARAASIRDQVEPRLAPDEACKLRRTLSLLEGEAWLARGRWAEAVGPLERAVADAPGDPTLHARALGSLGRAHYRRGDFAAAAPLLERSLSVSAEIVPERAAAVRALADIALREGRVTAAEGLWRESLELAMKLGSRDSEARARRGLAHLRVLQGRLDDAAELLDHAEELLSPEGDDRVRAAVIARRLELDLVAGRYGSALHRAERLLDLVQGKDLSERLPEALALSAQAHLAVGATERALRDARQAMAYGRAQGAAAWEARLRGARVLCALGACDEMEAALPEGEHLPQSPLDDPAAQLAALRASLLRDKPLQARDLAAWALVRPAPMLGFRAARIALDASQALSSAGDPSNARAAAKRGLKSLDGPGYEGLRLELLLALHHASTDDRALVAAGQIAAALASALPPEVAETFRARDGVAQALRAVS